MIDNIGRVANMFSMKDGRFACPLSKGHFMRLTSILLPVTATLAMASPASATFIQTSGVIVDNGGLGDFFSNAFQMPPVTDLGSGERLFFRLEFTNAEFDYAGYDQEFSTFSQFWVESSPGVFDLGFGPDRGVTTCFINANGNCAVSNFTIAQGTIALSHTGNILSGYVGYDNVNFNECDGSLFHIVGPICSEASGVIGPVSEFGIGQLRANFITPNGNGRYTFTIYSIGVPEPATWAMMMAGFGLVGGTMRVQTSRRNVVA